MFNFCISFSCFLYANQIYPQEKIIKKVNPKDKAILDGENKSKIKSFSDGTN